MSGYDVVENTSLPATNPKGWLIGDGEKARCFSAMQNVAYGPKQTS
jgi:hypothetical protein